MSRADKQISKGVLDMKFMQRTKKRIEEKEKKAKEAILKKAFFDSSQEGTTATSGNEKPLEFTKDLTFLEDLAFGRMSFKGFNPEVEKLMVYYERIRNGQGSEDEESDTDEKEINDKDMAAALGGAAASLRNKFKSKAQRTAKHEGGGNARLNFDPNQVRKRGADPGWGNDEPRKFIKPDE